MYILCQEPYLSINIDVKQNQCYEGNNPMYYEVHINEVNLKKSDLSNFEILYFDFNEPLCKWDLASVM